MAIRKTLSLKTYQKVKSYLEKVKGQGIEINQAFVFGSYAKGTFTKHSDIDLAIISPFFEKNRQTALTSLFQLLEKETREIEPLALSPKDFSDPHNPLAQEIQRSGLSVSP